jgi:phosphate transport system substrate-binding protein
MAMPVRCLFRPRWPIVAIVAAGMLLARSAGPAAQAVEITGAGATFPYPIYSAWFDEYTRTHTDLRISYQSIGSGDGIRQLRDLFVFFGATDTPMTEDELLAAPRRIVHLPTVVGAVSPIYNVPGVSRELNFSGPVLADIFLGKITNWNDPAIARLNANVTLPPVEITPVYRAESSGTSMIWSDYLAKTSPDWRRLVGATRTIKLPSGMTAKGSEGTSALVKHTVGAIGYVEVIYARRNEIAQGRVQNAEGELVGATLESISAAANAAIGKMPRDLRVSITNAPGRGAYPISSFTWLLLYESSGDRERSTKLVNFITWALSDGQRMAPDLGYAPLPEPIVELVRAMLKRVKVS